MTKRIIVALVAALASACGGGSSSSPPPTPPPAAPLSISIQPALSSKMVYDGAPTEVAFTATPSGSAPTPAFASAQFDEAIYSSVRITQRGNVYDVVGTTREALSNGRYDSPITFRLCRDQTCTSIHEGGSATHAVSLTAKLQEWTMFQRNAAHTGHVPVRLEPARFGLAWVWNTRNHARFGGLVPVEDAVYVTAGRKAFKLDAATGAQVWEYATPDPGGDWTGPPAIEGGIVYFAIQPPQASTGHPDGAIIQGLAASNGVALTQSPFISQAGPFNSPTFHDGAMYFSEGQYGNFAYRYNLPGGDLAWATRLGFDDYAFNFSQTPAVDRDHVYHATENGVFIIEKATGTLLGSAPTKTFGTGAVGGIQAPVITSSGLILRTDVTDNGRLVAIDPAARSVAWRGPVAGTGSQPVAAGNMVYSWMAMNGWEVGGINAQTGAVEWTWRLPAGESQLIENMVACENLLFVSSTTTIYAIDLATHQTVWTYPAHGKLSLSSGLVLYVLQSDYGIEDSRVTAIRLN